MRPAVVVFLAANMGLTPVWAEATGPSAPDCGEYFRQVIKTKVSRGDSLGVIYRDGTTVDGRFSGLSDDESGIWIVGGSRFTRVRTEASLSGVHALRYRDIAGWRTGTVMKWAVAGTIVGFVVSLASFGSVSSPSGEGFGLGAAYLLFNAPVVGGAVGILIGANRPRSGTATQVVRCGSE